MPGIGLAVLQAPDPPFCFDRYQFDRRPNAVSATTEISFDDYSRMGVQRLIGKRNGRRWTPRFAASDEQLRKVLTVAAYQYACGGRMPVPANTSLDELKKLVTAMDLKKRVQSLEHYSDVQKRRHCRHLFTNSWNGGHLEVLAAIAYRSWRLGWDSPTVAQQLFMRPENVRIVLYRLCQVARKLGFETFVRHPARGKETERTRRRRKWREDAVLYRERRRKRIARAKRDR